MPQLIYCLQRALDGHTDNDRNGISRFLEISKLYGNWAIPIDRSGTITTPLRTVSLFPIPEFRPFSKDYEEICDDRASSILKDAERMGVDINVLYSGGIDSTLLLVSLLKRATAEQRKHIVVLLSHESIAENPRFYDEHIRGKLRVGSSITFPELIGGKDMLLSAEHNDLLMGAELAGVLMVANGPESVHARYDRKTLSDFFVKRFGVDESLIESYFDLLCRIRDVSPVPIMTNMDFLWWINFVTKWQACHYYILLFTFAKHAPNVTKEYIDTRYISFYNTDEFQLWSMNNLNKRIRDTWKSYKWVCKDIIYDYTKDAEYRDHKTKKGSLMPLLGFDPPHHFIDEHLHFSREFSMSELLRPKNDFLPN